MESKNYPFVLAAEPFIDVARGAAEALDPIQRYGLFSNLRASLLANNVELGCLSSQLNISSTDPAHITASDLAVLLNHIRLTFPDAFKEHLPLIPALLQEHAEIASRA